MGKEKIYNIDTCGLYYKHVTIVNDNSSVINKGSLKLIDNARVVIYDLNRFIIQATGINVIKLFYFISDDEAQ